VSSPIENMGLGRTARAKPCTWKLASDSGCPYTLHCSPTLPRYPRQDEAQLNQIVTCVPVRPYQATQTTKTIPGRPRTGRRSGYIYVFNLGQTLERARSALHRRRYAFYSRYRRRILRNETTAFAQWQAPSHRRSTLESHLVALQWKMVVWAQARLTFDIFPKVQLTQLADSTTNAWNGMRTIAPPGVSMPRLLVSESSRRPNAGATPPLALTLPRSPAWGQHNHAYPRMQRATEMASNVFPVDFARHTLPAPAGQRMAARQRREKCLCDFLTGNYHNKPWGEHPPSD